MGEQTSATTGRIDVPDAVNDSWDSCEHGERCCVSSCPKPDPRSKGLPPYGAMGEQTSATTGRIDVPDGFNESWDSCEHGERCCVSIDDLCAEIKGRSRILAFYDTALRRHLSPVGEHISATTGWMDVPDDLNKSGESFQHSGRCRVPFNNLCAEIR
ncbi:unnamed protein product, partial [Ectocarpus sp. CCAP 1310/34]